MSSFFLGGVEIAAALLPLAAAAWQARRVLVPQATGLAARVVEGVLLLAAVVVLTEAWGAAGLFHRVPLALSYAACGLIVWIALRNRPTPTAAQVVSDSPAKVAAWIAGTGCAVAVVQWITWLGGPLHGGITDWDSLEYHLPLVARFVQTGSLAHLHYLSPDSPVHLHPLNSELLHGLGMLFLGSDLASAFLNIGWLVAAIGCGWAIGRRFGCGPAAGLTVAVVTAVPVMAQTQPGTAGNDVAALALFLAAVMAWITLPTSGGTLLVGGLAAGLALGTKVTVIAPCLALGLAVVLTEARGRRIRALLIWGAGAVLTGSFWYARNLVSTGSPNPSVHLGIGPITLPHARLLLLDDYGFSVAHYWNQPHVWRSMLLPGMASLGHAWPFLLAAAALASAAALAAPDRQIRLLALIAIVSGIAFVVTPAVALGFEGGPSLFAENLRYLTPALSSGMLLAVLLVARRGQRWHSILVSILALCLAATLIPGSWHPWPTNHLGFGIELAAGAAVVMLAAWRIGRSLLQRFPGWSLFAAASIAICVALLLAALENRGYERLRYARAGVYTWVGQHLYRQRIAIAGFDRQYPLYGPRFQNQVQYLGKVLEHGGFTRAQNCGEWLAQLSAGHYGYVVTRNDRLIGYPPAYLPEEVWTRLVSGARVLFSAQGATVFRLSRPPDRAVCPSGRAGESPTVLPTRPAETPAK